MKSKYIISLFLVFLYIFTLPQAVLAEDDDIEVLGLELEELLYLGSAILALVMFFLTQVAYSRSQNKRLLYVSLAFAIFAIKGLMLSSELFFEEINWFEPLASMLDFVILLLFFFGIIKR